MIGILSLLVALTLSLIVTRVAALALMFTGLSREVAKFQARSAFTGVGFTTGEAEQIVNHPVRRRIVMLLMLLGNIGVATVAATVIVSMSSAMNGQERLPALLGQLSLGLAVLWLIFRSRWVERRMNRVIAWALKRFTRLDVRDYVALLQLASGYAITEMLVESGDWLEEKTLAGLRLSDEGILVLSIRGRDGSFHATPRGEDLIRAGDTLILYGDLEDIRRLDCRRAGQGGDREHRRAVVEQDEYEAAERQRRAEQDRSTSDS